MIVTEAAEGAAKAMERPTLPFAPANEAEDAPIKPGMGKAMFPLDEGDVTLLFPEGLSEEALGDLGQYLDIFLKKEQRKGSGKHKRQSTMMTDEPPS